ncbi:MAG: efflux RND transporter periplasmic adaptor subunit [Candidatus Staskawiczbacteria bacterium]|nr:efflux RND transporter periplasmic adaptor subunit [Candidatus Staskawiczbacteria bacterium]
MKISKTWMVIIAVILIIIGYNVFKTLTKSPTQGLVTEKIQKGEVLQEVSETGSVRATQNISLGFKSIGKVSKIDVAVGDKVKKGDILAELESSQISAQIKSAKATLNYTINQHDSGVALAQDNLQSAYSNVQNILNDAYTKVYNAYNVVVSLQNNYFVIMDPSGVKVFNSKADIKKNMQDMKSYSDGAKTNAGVDSAISETLIDLDNIANDLRIIREQCDSGSYYNSVTAVDKSSLDTQKGYINQASSNIVTAQTSISSYKIALQKAQDTAAGSNNASNGSSVDSSQVQQAEANIAALQSQLNDNYLVSPINGIITEINTKKGQVVSSSQSVINMLSSDPFQIKVDIYEQDIVNIKVGDKAKIDLVAFPKKTFDGKVMSIDPAETIVDNVVYYEVTIEFPNQPQGIRSGMTADITIEANKKSNVLRIPKNAVIQIDGTQTAQVVKNGKVVSGTITTGLEGNDYFEVKSGLTEGEEIIVKGS